MAIERSLDWEPELNKEKTKVNKLNSVTLGFFIMSSLGILLCAKHFKG